MIKAKWGRIVNVSSVVASTGNPGQSNYVASKAALNGLTKSLALEELSMGMSADYLEAINFNSTYVRIGSLIFGSRG